MSIFKTKITELIELISVIFCRNIDDYNLIMELKFILLRGIRQFYMLLHVSYEKVSSCMIEIYDKFRCIFPSNQQDYWTKFFLSFKIQSDEKINFWEKNQQNYMQRYIKTRQNAFAMEILLRVHSNEIKALNDDIIFNRFVTIMRDVKLIHARHQFQKAQYRNCMIYLHEALIYALNMQKTIQKENGEDDLEQKRAIILMNLEYFCKMLKQTYMKLKKYENALLICKKLNWVHLACEIYQIQLTEKGKTLKKILDEYLKYCISQRLPEKVRILLHNLLEVQSSFQEKKKIINWIQILLRNPQAFYEEFKDDPKFIRQVYFFNLYDLSNFVEQMIFNFPLEKVIDIDLIIDQVEQLFNSENVQRTWRKYKKQKIDAIRFGLDCYTKIGNPLSRLQHKEQQPALIEHEEQQTVFHDHKECYASLEPKEQKPVLIEHKESGQNIEYKKFFNSILFKYLQSQANSLKLCAVNGIKINYNEQVENIPTFIIEQEWQNKKIDAWIIQHIETILQLTKNGHKEKKIKLDVKKFDCQQLQNIIIILDGQQIDRTFEQVVKIVKAVNKFIFNCIFILKTIQFTRQEFEKIYKQIIQNLLKEHQGSITQEEIQDIQSIFRKIPKASNEEIQVEYRQLHKQSILESCKLASIFDYIRKRNYEEIKREAKHRKMQLYNNRGFQFFMYYSDVFSSLQ